MLLYEVNLHLDADLAGAFEPWLRSHMQEMLAFDGFTRAVRFELEPTPDTLHWTVHYHVRDRALRRRYHMDRQAIQERFGITGKSPAILRELDRARQVARTDISVLIQGESGVGKELFAQAIHELSERRHKPLIIVNCGAIPEGLIESELFGNVKGAYTGAVERRSGYFEEADGSTIFLDEIGEMPAAAQVRLLRVLENGSFSRVGSSIMVTIRARVDFPQPDSPTTASVLPGCRSKLASDKARTTWPFENRPPPTS